MKKKDSPGLMVLVGSFTRSGLEYYFKDAEYHNCKRIRHSAFSWPRANPRVVSQAKGQPAAEIMFHFAAEMDLPERD